MPKLTLKFKDNVLGEFSIEPGKSLTIGRKESNDITIENLAVSGHHAKVDTVGDGYLLTDLQSKNGSFVNKELVTTHWLKHGDTILIGKHSLVFGYADDEEKPDEGPGSMDQTMVMDTDKYRDMLAKSVPSAAKAEKKEVLGVLSFLAGGDGEVELTKKLTKIGKNSACDIVVGGLMMGQTAVTISKRPNGYSLAYVEGMTKPKVNGETIKESVTLKEFDNIEIGSLKMQFIYKS
ncbi:MAG: FHA domain-containing protein [Desulfobacterales bacterium]|nr:FHA domain-containing protein [Desulfobacterales bacterium]